MKINYIGFGGTGNYPCYEDENGKIYFDLDNGHGELDLHTGAYRHPEDGDICGEPFERVMEEVECEAPFKRHPCTIRQLKNTVMKWKNYGNHLQMMRNRNG